MEIDVEVLIDIMKGLPKPNDAGLSRIVPITKEIKIQKTFKPDARAKGTELRFISAKDYKNGSFRWMLIV